MSEPVLPALSGDETLLGLSADYRDLLTDAEHQEMNEGLAWIAATRREGRGALLGTRPWPEASPRPIW